MSNTIISIILSFNVILLILFFVMKLHNNMIKRASDNLKRFEDEERKGLLVDGDMEKLNHVLSNRTIPEIYSNLNSALIETPYCLLTVIQKGALDKKTKEIGVIVETKSQKRLLNLSPLSLLDNTGEKSFCIRNDREKLIGFFTPFHVIVVNLETLQCTRTVENDECENVTEINVTEYTKDGVSVKHQTLKVHPFTDASEFIAEYYLREFKGVVEVE
jgi:hypothetical protein